MPNNSVTLSLKLFVFTLFSTFVCSLSADNGSAVAPTSPPPQPANFLSPIPNGKEVVDAYRAAYEKQKKPRLLLFVPTPTIGTETNSTPALSEIDTRQIEETFRRPFLAAGASFIEQPVSKVLIKDGHFFTLGVNDAGKEALSVLKQNTDIVIELLARHYDVLHPTPGGDTTVRRLDLVATAYDLRQPGTILAQASSESLFGFNQPGGTRRIVSDAEIIDQTALALMQSLSR